MTNEKLLESVKSKAKEVCNRRYIVTMPLYRKQKRAEIDRQKSVANIIGNFDRANNTLLWYLLDDNEREQLKEYFKDYEMVC